jgi:hypothetical protein
MVAAESESETDTEGLKDVRDGVVGNFVWKMRIQCEMSQNEVEVAGVAMYCQMPPQLG